MEARETNKNKCAIIADPKSKWLKNLESFTLIIEEETIRLNKKVAKPNIGIIKIFFASPIKSTPKSTFECRNINSLFDFMNIE